MTDQEILEKKREGDLAIVAEMIGESQPYTRLLIRRPGAKKHRKAMNALKKLVEARERAIQEARETENED